MFFGGEGAILNPINVSNSRMVSFGKGPLQKFSEQLPLQKCRVNFFSVFLCQRCPEIWREILV